MSFKELAARAAALREDVADKPVSHTSIEALAALMADVTAELEAAFPIPEPSQPATLGAAHAGRSHQRTRPRDKTGMGDEQEPIA